MLSDFNDVKEKALGVPIVDVLIHYGVEIVNNKISCLWHDDSDPSAHIYDNTNKGVCFGCGKSFDPISIVMIKENIGFKDAVLFLVNSFESSGRVITVQKKCSTRYKKMNDEIRKMIQQGYDINKVSKISQIMDMFNYDDKILIGLYKNLCQKNPE